MVLKLGKETPSNALEIYNKLKTLLDNKETFLCLVYDTTAGYYLGDCEAETSSNDMVSLTQYRFYFTQSIQKVVRYKYTFYANGEYERDTAQFQLALKE